MVDLGPERDEAQHAIVLAGLRAWRAEEPPSLFNGSPREFCQKMAEQCALYLLILGPNYGFVPEGQTPGHEQSITQMEFEWARVESARKIRVFQRLDAQATHDRRQKHFIDEAIHFDTGYVRFPPFSTPSELATQVAQALHDWLYDEQIGRDTWLRATRDRYSSVSNPLVGRAVAIDRTVSLQLRAKLVDPWIREDWHNSPSDKPKSRNNKAKAPKELSEDRRNEKNRAQDEAARGIAQSRFVIAPALDLLDRYQHLIVLGDPGAGKTTMLRRLAHDQSVAALGSIDSNARVPFYISADALGASLAVNTGMSITDALGRVAEAESLTAGLSPNEAGQVRTSVVVALEQGNALVLVDGLDEVDAEVRGHVADAMSSLRTNQIVMAMRPSVVQTQRFPGWTICEIQRLDAGQRQELVRGVFQTIGDSTDRHLDPHVLEQELDARPDLEIWAGNPLLLTLVATQYRVGGTLPEERAKIYEFAVEELTDHRRFSSVRTLTRGKLDQYLQHIALIMMRTNVATVDRDELTILLKQADDSISSDAVDEILGRASVLQQQAPGRWGFVHLTFQEYLAALAIAEMAPDQRRLELRRRRFSERWEQVYLLLVSSLDLRGTQGHEEADQVILDLIAADHARLRLFHGRDPSHTSLLRATRCQQSRIGTPSAKVTQALKRSWLPTWKGAVRREWDKYGMTLSGRGKWARRSNIELRGLEIGGAGGTINVGYGEVVALDVVYNKLRRSKYHPVPRIISRLIGWFRVTFLLVAFGCTLAIAVSPFAPFAHAIHANMLLPWFNLGWLSTFLVAWYYSRRRDRRDVVTVYVRRVMGDEEAEFHDFKRELGPLINSLRVKWLAFQVSSIRAIGNLGPEGAAAVPDLRRLLSDDDAAIQSAAADALGKIGSAASAAIPELRAALRQRKSGLFDFVRTDALAGAIVRIQGQNLTDVIATLKDPDGSIQVAAARALVRLGPLPEVVAHLDTLIELLTPNLNDNSISDAAKAQICIAIGEFGAAALSALPTLSMLSKSGGAVVRSAALQAIQSISPQAVRTVAIDDLHIFVTDPARLKSILSGGSWWRPSEEFNRLIEQLRTLGADVPSELVSDLASLRSDGNSHVRLSVAKVLGAIGSGDDVAVSTLLYLLKKDHEEDVRIEAIDALVNIGTAAIGRPDVIRALIRSLGGLNISVGQRASIALRITSPVVVSIAVQRLSRLVSRKRRAVLLHLLLGILRFDTKVPGIALMMATQILIVLYDAKVNVAEVIGRYSPHYANELSQILMFVNNHVNLPVLILMFVVLLLLNSLNVVVRFWLAMSTFYTEDYALHALGSLVSTIEDAQD